MGVLRYFGYSLAVGATLLAIGLIRWKISKRTPAGTKPIPGPWGIPWIGRVHDTDRMAPWKKMKEFSDEYNGFFHTEIMGDNHLWVGDQKISQELFGKRAAIYSSRPEVPAVPGSDTQGQYLPLMEYADPWKRQRKFAHTVLAQSHNARYYGYATHEVKRMLAKLLAEPKDYYAHGDRYCSRITARLAYGKPDAAVAISDNAHLFVPQISPAGPITNLMPFLGKLPEWANPSIRDSRLRREKEKVLWIKELAKVKDELAKGQCQVPSYARRFWELQAKGMAPFVEEEAAYAVGMLSTVAILTITGPLNVFFLAMTLHPEWQEKTRKEVDEVLGDRLAEVTDAPYLPTLRAVIQECIRWRPPVPLGVPRLAQEDDVYEGYFIPKGTIVHAVELAVARDPKAYPDPESYNPARWLDPAYPTYKEPLTEFPKLMGYHQFGCGKRMCPGVEISEAELLVACAAILWGFELSKRKLADGTEVPIDPEHMSPFLIGGALPFDFDLKPRSEKRSQQILDMWHESERVEDQVGTNVDVDKEFEL